VTGDALRARLRQAFVAAVAGVDLGARVREALAGARLGRGRVAVVAIGKAAPAMAVGALEALGPRVSQALVVAPDGTPAAFDDERVMLLRASHPDPDVRSVLAARMALQVASEAEALVVLVSGGASSLVCLPEGVTLARYVRLVRALRLTGADIRELNVVRRHLCALKGGGLARSAGGRVLTLLASDVVVGGVHDVGSGPSVADPTTVADARRVLRRYLPQEPVPPLHETTKPGDVAARPWRARVLATPRELAREVAARLGTSFTHVRLLPPSMESVDALVAEYTARASRLRPGEALVRASEPSLHVPPRGAGRGGRSTHLACAVARCLPPGVALLAAASDGDDGNSRTAGAVVDSTLGSAHAIARALRGFDTGPLVVRAGMALPGRPSGQNLADVHVLARVPR
jgi:hydroxypyruvate reductase